MVNNNTFKNVQFLSFQYPINIVPMRISYENANPFCLNGMMRNWNYGRYQNKNRYCSVNRGRTVDLKLESLREGGIVLYLLSYGGFVSAGFLFILWNILLLSIWQTCFARTKSSLMTLFDQRLQPCWCEGKKYITYKASCGCWMDCHKRGKAWVRVVDTGICP